MSKEKLPSLGDRDTLVAKPVASGKGLIPRKEGRSRNECGDGQCVEKTSGFRGGQEPAWVFSLQERGDDGSTVSNAMHSARYLLRPAAYSPGAWGLGEDTRTDRSTSRTSGTPDGTTLFSGGER